jgi:hypothetical protein
VTVAVTASSHYAQLPLVTVAVLRCNSISDNSSTSAASNCQSFRRASVRLAALLLPLLLMDCVVS